MYLARGGFRNEVAWRFHGFFCHQQWNVGIVDEPVHVFLEPDARPEVRWLPALGKGRYLADPFGIMKGRDALILCEEFSYQREKGVITQIRLATDGLPLSREVVIEMPFHLSYPYMFEWQGQVYCVPEMHQAREIALFRANELLDGWDKVATLVPNFAGVDPTIFFYQGCLWMTCTDADVGADNALFIWHASDLRGPWKPHAANPVKIGRNGTRPAGTPFVHRGKFYRPAMDSSKTYGRRVVINQVSKLTSTEFEEEPVQVVEPFTKGRYRYGVHTVSGVGDFTLVDGLSVTFERSEFDKAVENERQEVLRWLNRLRIWD